jgi:hypothetical protein
MSFIHLTTSAETMLVNEQDHIIRPGKWNGSKDWVMLGAVQYKYVYGRWTCIRTYSMDEVRQGKVKWFFKNGKQRAYVLDRDHGHIRVQMSPPLRRVYIGGTQQKG